MTKHERVARLIAAELQAGPPIGPCWTEPWEDVRNILAREYQDVEETPPKKKGKKEKEFNAGQPHTFQEWSDHGYRIKKGSKATGRNEAGVATFIRNQVVVNNDVEITRYPLDEMFFPDESELF